MKSLHLTLMAFCHLLIASVVLYLTSSAVHSFPLNAPQPDQTQHKDHHAPAVQPEPKPMKASSPQQLHYSAGQAAESDRKSPVQVEPAPAVRAAPVDPSSPVVVSAPKSNVVQPVVAPVVEPVVPSRVVASPPAVPVASESAKQVPVVVASAPAPRLLDEVPAAKVAPKESSETKVAKPVDQEVKEASLQARKEVPEVKVSAPVESPKSGGQSKQVVEPKSSAPVSAPQKESVLEARKEPAAVEMAEKKPESVPKPAALVSGPEAAGVPQMEARSLPVNVVPESKVSASSQLKEETPAKQEKAQPMAAWPVDPFSAQQEKQPAKEELASKQPKDSPVSAKMAAPVQVVPVSKVSVSNYPAAHEPVVNGGLGPLHLLATTLCSYQPDRPVADDSVNQLYARRAIVRKSLFDFMSLKFTNLEKLSSRLGYGLQVVPVKSVPEPTSGQQAAASKPSHGWPVVGKCTAHDLRLMGEAAWCECSGTDQECPKSSGSSEQGQQIAVVAAPADPMASSPVKASESSVEKKDKEVKEKSARSMGVVDSFSPEQSSVMSKILHIGDVKEAPVVESNFYNLNLTQHQLETLQAQATSTQECRRNALRYSKALFQHLAEDQTTRSDSWPKLYAQISTDDCARKRMIDIVNALSSFRTDTTSIRRDNVEFAFAMDDLRTKVLENEVNVPLTFDRHFIEVEQFLQQSVRLMLASVQPKRAKLTSMRYRSLMYGASMSADDQQQCIDLHQRLLAKNYPSDCNPTQFGQLPDVLRMTANSLELWSIEKELSMHFAKIADYPNTEPAGQQKVKEDVNECIANLVAS